MTLIAVAFNKLAICVSTDTQLTFTTDGSSAGEAVKSNYVYCKNGKFLAAYTGNDVYLEDGVHVSDWITNLLDANEIQLRTIDDIISSIVNGLNEKYYYKRIPEPLTILFAGWIFEEGQALVTVFRITNCEAENSSQKAPSRQFNVYQSNDKRGVIVRGSVRLGVDHRFDGKIKHIKKLLKTAPLIGFRDTIGRQLFELNTVAHNHPQWGSYIGEKTMLSIIHKRGDGVDYWRYPEGQKDYMLPNFNNGKMSIRGLRVHNDPVEGGYIELYSKKTSP